MVDSRLHVARVSLTVLLKVPDALLQRRLPAPISILGAKVADQVCQYCERNGLNYYPALDYLQQQQVIDAYLLDAIDETSNIAATICNEEIYRLLTPVFSSVSIDSMQCVAYAMPTCRPGKADSRQKLTEHFIPDTIKLELKLSSIQRQQASPGFEKYVSSTVTRWLKEIFESPQITTARLIQDQSV